MKVAVLGPEGTYTHEAAKKYFEDLQPEFCATIREVFESDTKVKFIPVENSLGGDVTDTIDLLRENDETITGEVRMSIEHALISEEEFEDIRKVCSHPQAVSQCKQLVNKNNWDVVEKASTAEAVETLEEGEAAIASEISAEINGKPVLRKSVQDTDSNTTRFFVLNGNPTPEKKTSMILEPGEDRPGLLHAMLSCFAGHEINLSHIQSRPTREELGQYYFYIEAEVANGRLDKAVQCLKTYADVNLLGKYGVKKV